MTAISIFRRTIMAIAFVGAFVAHPISAATAAVEPAALDDKARSDIARIEAYLNALTTLDSKFVQLSQDGFAEGRLRLSRPGDLRIDYAPPIPVQVVASGLLVMYYDYELEQTTFLPVFETPAYFLLKDTINLSDGVTVTAFEREASAIRVTLVETDNPDAGQITIVFEDKPLRLAKWRVVDAQGNVIDVALVNPIFGIAFEDEDDLFSTLDPAHRRLANPGAD